MIYVALNKKLIVDISNQVKSLSVAISVDDIIFYDIVAHTVASPKAQHFVIHISFILVLLKNYLIHEHAFVEIFWQMFYLLL